MTLVALSDASCTFRTSPESAMSMPTVPDCDQFLEDIPSKINLSCPTILAGDFNTVFDRSLDSCCVLDIWCYRHLSIPGFTWFPWNGSLASRIDLFGVPYLWDPLVSSCDILPCPFSDHSGVLLSFSIPDVIPPGPGLEHLY